MNKGFNRLMVLLVFVILLSTTVLSFKTRKIYDDPAYSEEADFIPDDPTCIPEFDQGTGLINTDDVDPFKIDIPIYDDLDSNFTKQLILTALFSDVGERSYFNGTHYSSIRLRKFVKTIRNATHFYDGNKNEMVNLRGRKNYDCDDFASDLEIYLQNKGYNAVFVIVYRFENNTIVTKNTHALVGVYHPNGGILLIEPQKTDLGDGRMVKGVTWLSDWKRDGKLSVTLNMVRSGWLTEDFDTNGVGYRISVFESSAESGGETKLD